MKNEKIRWINEYIYIYILYLEIVFKNDITSLSTIPNIYLIFYIFNITECNFQA